MALAATIAACVAALVSLVNVFATSWLGRHSLRQQWRREAERPIVAAFLSCSDQCLEAWNDAALSKQAWINSFETGHEEHRKRSHDDMVSAHETGSSLVEKMTTHVAELDLVAGSEVCRTTKQLLKHHCSIRHMIRPAGAAGDPYQAFRSQRAEIDKLRTTVVKTSRADIGVALKPK